MKNIQNFAKFHTSSNPEAQFVKNAILSDSESVTQKEVDHALFELPDPMSAGIGGDKNSPAGIDLSGEFNSGNKEQKADQVEENEVHESYKRIQSFKIFIKKTV